MRIAVFVSGSGTNLQALIDAENQNYFKSTIALVVSNNADAYGLERAKRSNIPCYVEKDEAELIQMLRDYNIDLIVLAGYLKIISHSLLELYEGKIINIHPALLPDYGGKGMYGMHVHNAVFKNHETVSGATVHYVTDEIDGGEKILQFRCNIADLESADAIQERVLILEHLALKAAIKIIEED